MAEDFARNFARVVRRLRVERGMTQSELAQRLGLGRTSVTNIENGDQVPSVAMLPAIASALGVTLVELVSEAAAPAGAAVDASPLAGQVADPDLRQWTERVIREQGASGTAKKARSR